MTYHLTMDGQTARRLQLQLQARHRMKHQRLRVAFIGYIIVLAFLATLQFIGVYFFTLGFLLTRLVLDTVALCPAEGCEPAAFDRAVVVLIDALRFDFAIPVVNGNAFHHNQLPILHNLAQQEPENAVLLKFVADPPTTTLQRLKGLTTGSLPTFIDAGLNFNGDAVTEDNWLLQLFSKNKTIAFAGDDTWTALFDAYIDPKLNFPYPSLNVWDLHTVDRGVQKHLLPLLESSQWDLLVGHLLGVDHAGHRYGPSHYAMREKLQEMNGLLEKVVRSLDDRTLLIVMGDHGMDHTGNHGGLSRDELDSTLFMYAKKPHFRQLDKSLYSVDNLGRDYRAVDQIDLVPTISLLLGLPIPYNNLGFPIDEAFNETAFARASELTVRQIQLYRDHMKELHHDTLDADFYSLMQMFVRGKNAVEAARTFQALALDHCRGLWARFDLVLITLGVSVLVLSLAFVLTYSRLIPPVRVLTMLFEFIGLVVAMTLLGIVLSMSIFVVLSPAGITLKTCILSGSAVGIAIGFWAPIMDRFSVFWLGHQIFDFFAFNLDSWLALGLLIVGVHCLLFASNSFVIWEDQIILFFLSSFGFCCLFAMLGVQNRTQKLMGVMHSITFIVLSRLASSINLCREEQKCESSFKTTWWAIILLHCATFMLPSVIAGFYKLSQAYQLAAPLWIGTGMKFLMAMNATHWTLEFIENDDLFETWRPFVSGTLLKLLRLAIARVVLFVSLVLANFSWSRGPLCVRVQLNDLDSEDERGSPVPAPKPQATILGYGNVYGSSYFLLVINFATAVLLVTKPLGAISISMMLVQLLLLLELYVILDLRRNLIAVVVFALLGYQHFFSTGHQATIPSVQWDAGFLTTQTIVFPFTHLNIVLNTFGPFFIVCLSVPLITLWRLPPSAKPITVLSQIVTTITTLLTYQTLVSISSFAFAAHFRRHLMVWKIFAPRFILSALLLVVFNVTLFATLWFAVGRVLTQINRIFGR